MEQLAIDIQVYFNTANMTVNSNASNVKFRGSEQTMFGLGSGDAFANLADLSGLQNLGAGVSANGATGIGWYYEKVGESDLGLGDISEKLYLVDANDGGNANVNGGALDWNILATIDLSGTASDWYRLSISIDALGNGVAIFNNQTVLFTTTPGLKGEFYVDYRENAQLGSVGVPDFLRPATFAVPEPSSAALLALGALTLLFARHRK